MSKETTLIVLGLLIMALRTVMGLPGEWQTLILFVAGAAVAVIGFLLRGESLARSGPRHNHTSFVEHHPEESHTHDHAAPGLHSLN